MNPDILSLELETGPLDLAATTAKQLLGRFDPTGGRTANAFLKVHSGRGGKVLTWRLSHRAEGLGVEVQGGNEAHLAAFAAQFPLADGAENFLPAHPLLRRLAAFRGLRLMRVPWPFDVAAAAVLQQRVRWQVGCTDFRKVAIRYGLRTSAGTAFPSPARLAQVPVFELEGMGLDHKRARALHGLARAQVFRPFLLPDADLSEVRKRLLAIPGIGPWTTAMTMGYGYGDPDAVPVGDLHLPALVASALAGEESASDERMLELLQPYDGQRFRVIRLLLWAWRAAPHHVAQATGPKSA